MYSVLKVSWHGLICVKSVMCTNDGITNREQRGASFVIEGKPQAQPRFKPTLG